MKSIFSYCLFFLTIQLSAQNITVQISITADEFPQDISWEIRDQFSNKVKVGDLEGCEPFQMCSEEFDLEDQCYIFIIKDDFGDGLSDPAGFEIFVNGELQGMGNDFPDNAQIDLNCKIGESCKNAVLLDLPDNGIRAPKDKDYWFKLVPEVSGLYRMNTCLNTITGQGNANTTMWVYDTCDALIHQEGAEGALGFSDDSSQCAPGSGFNYVPLEEGEEYLIRTRVNDPDWPVDSILVRVQKLPPLSGCTDPSACNFNPFASQDNGSCIYEADCRPDLRLDEEELKNSIILDRVFNSDECLIEEGCLTGNGWRDVIKFSTKIDNIGSADYIVGIPERNPQNFSKENCHGHWHHQGYAEYLLFSGSGQPEPVGFKNGFCVLDLDCETDQPKYLCSYMGITAGCSDIYDNEIDCQWIDITDIEDGQYTLVARVNWNRLADMRNFQEITYENNWGQVCVEIDRSTGVLDVRVLDDCEQYTDCLGMTFGQTAIDCNGICGGNSEFGDLNNNAELDEEDVAIYLDLIENKLQGNLACADLSGDSDLSIYDVTLLQECIITNIEEENNPFHTHCIFPVERINLDQKVELKVVNFDVALGELHLDIRIPDNDIRAFQIPFEGIVIDSFEKMYIEEATYINKNQNEIISLHEQELISRGTDFRPFLKVYFSNLTGDSLCIGSKMEFVNKEFELIPGEIEDECLFLTSNNDEIKAASNSINVFPNPVSEQLKLNSRETLLSVKILNIEGIMIHEEDNILDKTYNFDANNLSPGIYVLRTIDIFGEILIANFVVK